MDRVNIKSENQSGGITAQNVNTVSKAQFTQTSLKEPKSKTIFWWIFGFAGLAGSSFTIYKFFFS